MDEPARKRRKTSSPADRRSSPLRKPARRPSFASPTKASLARNYPNLLPPRPSTAASPSRPSSRGDMLARGKQARAFVLGESDLQSALDEEATRERATQDDTLPTTNTPPRARNAAGARTAPDAADEEEPDLPTTPSQRALEEQDGPRRGVLFSSPSKRPPRAKGRVNQSPLRRKASPVQEAYPTQHTENGPEGEDTQARAGKKQAPDLEVERRRQEKARLQREVAELQAQVSRCIEEIVQEQQRTPGEALRSTSRTDLQKFITTVSGLDSDMDAATPMSSLLCSFLPFSAIAIPQSRSKAPGKHVPSHRPIELVNPLPYLEMFTSLKFSTQLALPRGKISPSSKRVHQKHTIDIVSPQKLLTAQISVIIDSLANQVIDMHVLELSPWAERELGTHLRQCAQEKDLSHACWAIESYWNIVQKRAQHWHRCENTFAHLAPGRTGEDRENTHLHTKANAKMSRKDLRRHLGRDSLILQDSHVLLKLNWRIGFDWTGEAESQVAIEPAFPRVWTEADTTKTFGKVPETFASLLHSRGAFEATRVIVALLFAQ